MQKTRERERKKENENRLRRRLTVGDEGVSAAP